MTAKHSAILGWLPSRRALAAWSFAALLAAAVTVQADGADAWLDPPPATSVSGGELRFLTAAGQRRVHHHLNTLEIHAGSLRDGWVRLWQCHRHLDPVARAQILFRKDRIRNLRVTAAENVGAARVDGHSVQLEEVGADARLCLQAETRALRDSGDGTFVLRNGPFMRRYLDGYYPMRVYFEIQFAPELLEYFAIEPAPQAGFWLWRGPGRVSFEALFEGELTTEVFFTRP